MGEGRPVRGLGVAHDERKQNILEAVFEIVEEAGTDQVSIRHVAERARVSVGRVQHYFPTKDELLTAAFEAINQRGTERIREQLESKRQVAPAAVVRTLLDELVPARPEDVRMFRIATEFESYAVRRPLLRERLRAGYEDLTRLVTALLIDSIGERSRADDVPSDELLTDRARELLGLAVGMASLVVNGGIEVHDARRVLGSRAEQILRAVHGSDVDRAGRTNKR